MDSFYEPISTWPQPKNYIARPSVKSLIEHSCSNQNQPPAPLDPSLIVMHERGLKDLAEAREQAKVPASLQKLEAELVEAENALKKNRWSKVDDKKAYVERLKREIQEAKGTHILTSERLASLEKRYGPVNAVVEEHGKIVEIYERYMKNRTEYYGLSITD
jgi:hypothetical protein